MTAVAAGISLWTTHKTPINSPLACLRGFAIVYMRSGAPEDFWFRGLLATTSDLKIRSFCFLTIQLYAVFRFCRR
jgi:hypothetical protein